MTATYSFSSKKKWLKFLSRFKENCKPRTQAFYFKLCAFCFTLKNLGTELSTYLLVAFWDCAWAMCIPG